MPTLGLVEVTVLIGGVTAVLAVAVVIAALVITKRRRRAAADRDRPRTVADLVRLRAEAEQALPDGSDGTSEPATAAATEDRAAEVHAAEIADGDDGGRHRHDAEEPDPEPDDVTTPELGIRKVVVPPQDVPARPTAPVLRADGADDTPWDRAARMGAAEEPVWIPAARSATPLAVESVAVEFPAAHAVAEERLTLKPLIVESVAAQPVAVEPAAASRARKSVAETAAEQAAADLALLRTFGFADPGLRPEAAPVISLAPIDGPGRPAADGPGPAQLVRFRAIARDGSGVAGAGVTLLDDRGRQASTGTAGADGRGELRAPRPGAYVVISTAADHQPGAVAITVADDTVEAEVLLARSAALIGSVLGEDGPVEGARLTLVQDGEIVDAVESGADGTYRIGDLAAGDYGLSVVAAGCEPVVVLVEMPDGTDLVHDVDLDPAGPLAEGLGVRDDDVMIGHR